MLFGVSRSQLSKLEVLRIMKFNTDWFLILITSILIGMCYGQVDAVPLDDHGDTYKEATELFFDIPQTGLIDSAEDIDYFRLEIPEPGELTVYTTGSLDTIGSMEDDAGVFAEGDQEGEGNNLASSATRNPETYYIGVRGYRECGPETIPCTPSFVPGAEPGTLSPADGSLVADPETIDREPIRAALSGRLTGPTARYKQFQGDGAVLLLAVCTISLAKTPRPYLDVTYIRRKRRYPLCPALKRCWTDCRS